MKAWIFYIIIFVGIIALFTTCKKYDEDGKRSWHKPEKRILGKWFLKEFLVDGVDSVYKWYEYKTVDYRDTIYWQLINTRFSFSNNSEKAKLSTVGKKVDIYNTNVYINNSYYGKTDYFHLVTGWGLNNSNKQLAFDSKYYFLKEGQIFAQFSIFGNVNDSWDIKKLTDKEMILEADRNDNKHLRLKLQK